MAEIGKKNHLEILKQVDFGLYLDGGELGEILLPRRYKPEKWQIGDYMDVFVYLDSDDRPVATTEEPLAQVDSCANLKVVQIGKFGAFMNWGLAKDLLVPFKEQRVPMQVGSSYVVFVFIDATGRIAASSKLSRFLKEENRDCFQEGQKVTLLLASRSDLGYKAVINGTHLGLIHNNELFQQVRVGDTVTGYIKEIRGDDRINLTLQASGKEVRDSLREQILAYMKLHGGCSSITDNSRPEEIYKEFKVSKSNYKKAIGSLYKDKLIVMGEGTIRLPKRIN